MDEQVFLESGTVKVTNTRFVVGAQTYAMSSVNSVKIAKIDLSPSNAFPGLLVAVGAIWLSVHIVTAPLDVAGHLVPLALLGGAIWWIWNTKEKYEYRLVLTTSSGETPVLASFRAGDILPVEKALTDAIVYRG
jgi:hypothetical protein